MGKGIAGQEDDQGSTFLPYTPKPIVASNISSVREAAARPSKLKDEDDFEFLLRESLDRKADNIDSDRVI